MKRHEHLPDGIRMIRFDVARLDPRFAVPARGWHRVAVMACFTLAVAVALAIIRCSEGGGP